MRCAQSLAHADVHPDTSSSIQRNHVLTVRRIIISINIIYIYIRFVVVPCVFIIFLFFTILRGHLIME